MWTCQLTRVTGKCAGGAGAAPGLWVAPVARCGCTGPGACCWARVEVGHRTESRSAEGLDGKSGGFADDGVGAGQHGVGAGGVGENGDRDGWVVAELDDPDFVAQRPEGAGLPGHPNVVVGRPARSRCSQIWWANALRAKVRGGGGVGPEAVSSRVASRRTVRRSATGTAKCRRCRALTVSRGPELAPSANPVARGV